MKPQNSIMRPSPDKIQQMLFEDRLLPLFYHDDLEICKAVIKACYDGGARLFEFTHRGVNAQRNFIELRTWTKNLMPELALGVGTVKTESAARFYAQAEADFIVCPIVDEETAVVCKQHNLLWIPGCMTPTEIAKAEKAGAKLVKLFPGEVLGSQYIRSIRPLFPDLSFMVTGGVTLNRDNLCDWIDAGAKALGMGSKLITSEIIANQQFSAISHAIEETMKIIKR